MRPRPEVLIFDCDGVLLDANTMKINAFREALADYPAETVALFSAYQAKNFGRSRYVLFSEFFNFLGRDPQTGEVNNLVERYARIVRQAYLEVPLTPGCLETLSVLQGEMPLYVASGSDQDELRWVFRQRHLDSYFTGIFGSPESKSALVSRLANDAGATAMLVGDAPADFAAATASGQCAFVYMSKFSTANAEMADLAKNHGFATIELLPELLALLV